MKVRFIIEGNSESFMAKMDLSSEVADVFARLELDKVKITKLQITEVQNPNGTFTMPEWLAQEYKGFI